MKKHVAHRMGESTYSYRGWTILYNYECKLWFPISPNGDNDWTCKTLKEAKADIDNLLDNPAPRK